MADKISRAPKRIAEQIAAELRNRIQTGFYDAKRFPSAEQLRTDRELVKMLRQVPSRQAIRHAVGLLVGSGWLSSDPKNPRAGMRVHSRRFQKIAFVCYHVRFDFDAGVLAGIDEAIQRHFEKSGTQYRLICALSMAHGDYDEDTARAKSIQRESELIRELHSEVDGLIILPVSNSKNLFEEFDSLRERRFPAVLLGQGLPHKDGELQLYTSLVIYPESVIAQRVVSFVSQQVRECGITTVLIVGEELNRTLCLRANNIRGLLETSGLNASVSVVLSRKSRAEAGERATLQSLETIIMANKGRVLIVATTDLAAVGVLQQLEKSGLKVPDDVAVIGIDGDEFAKNLGLTTLCLNPHEVGKRAAELLLGAIEASSSLTAEEISVFGGVGDFYYGRTHKRAQGDALANRGN